MPTNRLKERKSQEVLPLEAPSSLPSSEWLLALIFLMLIAALIAIAKINAWRSSDALNETLSKKILIAIEGAVKKPDSYWVDEGTSVEEALLRARPLKNADLNSLPLKKIIDVPLELQVETLKMIRIAVEGEIAEPLTLDLPIGSRICDLKSKVIFTPETKKSFFRRKKLLQNGDKIVVPKKTVE